MSGTKNDSHSNRRAPQQMKQEHDSEGDGLPAASIKVIEEIDLVFRILRENWIDDESFVQWLTNEITGYALPVEKSVLPISGDMRKPDIRELIVTAKRYSSNEFVQRDVAEQIGSLVFAKDNDFCVELIRQGGVELVAQAMTRFPNEQLQRYGCLALANLASIDDLRTFALGGIELVVKAMSKFPDNAQIQRNACLALGNLAVSNAEGCVSISRQGEIGLVVRAMTKFKNIEVQEFGCAAVGNLAWNIENRVVLSRLGGLELVLQAMTKFSNNEHIQRYGCLALGNLSAGNEANRAAIARQDGADLVVHAMTTFANEEDVQRFGCLALGNLASENECGVLLTRRGEAGSGWLSRP